MNPMAVVAGIGGLVSIAIAALVASGKGKQAETEEDAGFETTATAAAKAAAKKKPAKKPPPKKAAPAPAKKAAAAKPFTGTVEERVAAAIASADPRMMASVAAQLAREGFSAAARSLADEIERLERGSATVPSKAPPPTKAPAPTPAPAARPPPAPAQPPPPPRPAPAATTEIVLPTQVITPSIPEDPQRVRARNLTSHLQSLGGLSGRGKENQSLVSAFQSGEGLTADGKYGPGTSIRILERYGIIPVVPYWWSKNEATWKQQKATYIGAVRRFATSDPERAAEYNKLIADTNRS